MKKAPPIFELHKIYGKLITPGRSYFLIEYFPKTVNSAASDNQTWPKNARGFFAVPDQLVDKEDMIYSYPRTVISNMFTVEYAVDKDLEIKTLVR